MDPGEVKNINIAACHRIRGSRDATKESIIVRFVELQQRDYIFNLAKKLPKGSGYGVMVETIYHQNFPNLEVDYSRKKVSCPFSDKRRRS